MATRPLAVSPSRSSVTSMALLLISLLLGLACFAGVGWIVVAGWLFTQDGLFMSLILLAMAGVFFLNAVLELYDRGLLPGVKPKAATAAANAGATAATPVSVDGLVTEVGVAEKVEFFEAPIGQPDKSIVTFRPAGADGARLLVFNGDVRNQIRPSRRVQITYTPAVEGNNNLLSVR